MLIDSAIIEVRSGRGGDGCVSFHRAKYVPKGGPDGGDGGDGGDVILIAEQGIDTLLDFKGRHHWRAKKGENGKGKQQIGRSADDLLVKLPPGTLVYDDESGDLLVDLDETGKQFVAAKGGKGGYGNERYKTAIHQTPRESTPGGDAEEKTLRLELKLIADIGLIGLPNAGKSTLLSAVSKARPKVADYPFTTLEPNLGIAELQGHRRIVIADLPGLIEGASEGHGLGIRFLRHVERTNLLLHLIDVDPLDGSDPIENYHAIRKELAGYSEELASKTEIIAISKMDLLPTEEDRAAAVELIEQELGLPTFAFSSATKLGVDALLEQCWDRLDKKERHVGWGNEDSDDQEDEEQD